MGEDPTRSPSSPAKQAWESVRRHPYITATFLVCTVVGAMLGLVLLTGDWSALRRLLAGSVAGASTALLVTATKLLE